MIATSRRLELRLLLSVAAAALLFPVAAMAHPSLVGANPAANASVPRTATITLSFNEKLMPKLSGAKLIMTGMPGMKDHPDMPMKATASVDPDGKTIVVKAASPLPAGSYRVDWHVVSSDTHRITGSHSFSVR
ncbi:MAG: copper homeostasis periplasmic binding protein CopC [Sphingobium sp.]